MQNKCLLKNKSINDSHRSMFSLVLRCITSVETSNFHQKHLEKNDLTQCDYICLKKSTLCYIILYFYSILFYYMLTNDGQKSP